MIEGSKAWARELCARHGIPAASFGGFTDPGEALAFLDRLEPPYVVKADGLAAGKGVTVAERGPRPRRPFGTAWWRRCSATRVPASWWRSA